MTATAPREPGPRTDRGPTPSSWGTQDSVRDRHREGQGTP